MASSRGTSDPDSHKGKRRRVESVNDPLRNGDAVVGQDYYHNSAQDNARVHYGNVYGDVHHHGPLLHDQPQSQHGSESVHVTRDVGKLLKSLRFEQMGHRHANINRAHTSTCKWLLEHPKYLDWKDADRSSEHNGLLWIKGKPGAGKSTIVKFAYDDTVDNCDTDTAVGFFFSARGSTNLEKTIEGLYRSLLVQILEKVPTIYALLDSRLVVPLSAWSIQTLKDLFTATVMNLKEARLVCFIDALDECCEDEIREMVEFLEELGESAISKQLSFRVLYASRHYPHITTRRSLQLVLEGQAGHQHDIQEYIRTKLRIAGPDTAEIRKELEKRASGVFLWIVLVVNILQKECDRGRMHALRQCLNGVPDDLNRLFTDMLGRQSENNKELVLTLQWILYARRQLRVEQLYHAILIGTEPSAVKPLDQTDATSDDMRRFILDCSRGLVEVTLGSRPVVQFIHETVRDFFGHQGGLEMLDPRLGEKLSGQSHNILRECCFQYMSRETIIARGLSGSDVDIASPFKVFSSEAGKGRKRSKKHDPFLEYRKRFKTHTPFLEYAVAAILYHANAAEGHGISQDIFVEQFRWRDWVSLLGILEVHETPYNHPAVDRMYILANEGLVNLLRPELGKRQHRAVHVDDERYLTVIEAATAYGSFETVQALLDQSSDLPPVQRARLINLGVNWTTTKVLSLLLDAGIHHGLEDFEVPDSRRNRILRHALYRRDEASVLVQSLWKYSQYKNEFLPLVLYDVMCMEHRYDREDVARILLGAGWKIHPAHILILIDPVDHLQYATSNSSFWQLFVKHTADDPVLRSVLSTLKGAIRRPNDGSRYDDCTFPGAERRIDILCENWLSNQNGLPILESAQIDPGTFLRPEEHDHIAENWISTESDTDLVRETMAARRGVEVLAAAVVSSASHSMLQLLLEEGMSPDLMVQGLPLLHIACALGDAKMSTILLNAGAVIDTRADILDTKERMLYPQTRALMVACHNGHAHIVNVLLGGGTGISNLGAGVAALLVASTRGHFDIVQMILARQSQASAIAPRLLDFDSFMDFGSSFTSPWNHEMVEMVLDEGISPDLVLPLGLTLLQIVGSQGNETAAQLLLDRGANVNLRGKGDYTATTALSLACTKGHVNIVRLLFNYGLDKSTSQLWPALVAVCEHGRTDILRTMVANGVKVIDWAGFPDEHLLSVAKIHGHDEIVQVLWEATTWPPGKTSVLSWTRVIS